MKRKLREYFRQSSVWAAHQMLSPKSCFQCWLHMSLRGDSALFQGRLSDNSTWDLFCLSKDFLFVHLLFFSRWCFKALCSKYFLYSVPISKSNALKWEWNYKDVKWNWRHYKMQLEISFLWYNDYVVKFDDESEKEFWHAILVSD